MGIPQCVVHSLYRSSTRGPEDDSVESKHVAPLSHYMFNFTTVVFDGTSPAFYYIEQHNNFGRLRAVPRLG